MKPTNTRAVLVLVCCLFLTLGIINASTGPLLPELAHKTGSSLGAMGALFSAIFFGALLMQLVVGPISDRIGPRRLLIGSLMLLAPGILGVALSPSLPLLLTSALFAGMGHGVVVLSSTVLVAQTFASRSTSALNTVNLFYGVGAILGPLVGSMSLSLWGTGLPSLWLGDLLIWALIVPTILIVPNPPKVPSDTAPTQNGSLYRTPLLWAFGALLLFYVGIEIGTSGWATSYLMQGGKLDQAMAALAVAGFWLALAIGRAIAAVMGQRVAPQQLLLTSLVGTLAGGLLLVLSDGYAAGMVAAVALIGLSFGPVFPTTTSIVAATFPHAAGRAVNVVGVMASIGGLVIPWFQGILLVGFGSLTSTLLVPLVGVAMLIVFRVCQQIRQQEIAYTAPVVTH